MQSKPQKITIEIAPLTFSGPNRSQVKAMERQTKKDADAAIRQWLGLGPYSKVVQTRMQDLEK